MIKKVVAAAAVVTAIGVGTLTPQSAFAQTSSTAQNPMSTLVQKIAQKFNLNQADVQAVFDEEHAAREAKMKTQREARLTQLVTDGKITEAQKQAIIAKQQEMESTREANKTSFQSMTEEQRKTAMDTERQALQKWATDNGIDLKYLMFGRGMHGHGGPRPDGQMPTASSTPAASPAQ